MARTAKTITYNESDLVSVQKIVKGQKSEQRMGRRVAIILKLIEGKQI